MGNNEYSSLEEQVINADEEVKTDDKIVLFLREKEVLAKSCTKWIVKFEDGKEFDIVQLIHEFIEKNK